jgi:hypothetical protein
VKLGEIFVTVNPIDQSFTFQAAKDGAPVGEPSSELHLQAWGQQGFTNPTTDTPSEVIVSAYKVCAVIGDGTVTNQPGKCSFTCPSGDICQWVTVQSTYASLALQQVYIEPDNMNPAAHNNPDTANGFSRSATLTPYSYFTFATPYSVFPFGNLPPNGTASALLAFQLPDMTSFTFHAEVIGDAEPLLRGNFTAGGASATNGAVSLRGRFYYQGTPAVATAGTVTLAGRLH